MFIDFADQMINTTYIVSIFKTNDLNRYFEVNIRISHNDYLITETYNTEKERDNRFNEIINIINKQ